MLFGPTLVCGMMLLVDMGAKIIRRAEGLATPGDRYTTVTRPLNDRYMTVT